ncbi:MAG: L,D-transpeptidase family protein [Burkholderiaceae bacterium]
MKQLLFAPAIVVCGLLAYANWPSVVRPIEKQADSVIVYKAERRMVLMRDGEALRTYTVSLGGNPTRPKRQEGDSRTPEGSYMIDYRKPDSSYYKALHISYPSAADVSAAKQMGVDAGSLIMIHGMRNGLGVVGRLHRLIDWTNGCIAVTNQEMDEVWSAVPDGTPIEIRP